ncbi:potassium-transporting ATPase subunit C [Chimaeribacter californicus]|uniref:Potassium-transporting ATPase KdpC subunit n=1 Tax=Chimaeribacter californicus TaxID=2060067 RepID=A0A2N5EA73_9GAMM|nr:potassium-transporting ATPase subunit KdpC [Chimaeribacter californicus]PLR38818.1 potassium-transporting ATPase subunit C [Chimaeribacter californicus]
MMMLRPMIVVLLLLSVLTGIAYPLLTNALSALLFSAQANGSLLYRDPQDRDRQAVGSLLIGQNFTRADYFWGRPSATSPTPYATLASAGSNLAGSNPALDQAVAARVNALRAANPQSPPRVPVELVTASGSGLDPQISPMAARWQIPRIAQARGIPAEVLEKLIAAHTDTPFPAFIGEPGVNVLQLNRALDALNKDKSS